ncbi:MAG: hypothetical protein IB617_02495 [Candidatus Nealsonbacteria bacterium]|nr:MAG: hypothetical protein IB617_02495 [Candidatus Nealsonbacteria bacterium]
MPIGEPRGESREPTPEAQELAEKLKKLMEEKADIETKLIHPDELGEGKKKALESREDELDEEIAKIKERMEEVLK